MCQILLQAGTNPNLRLENFIALDHAVNNGHKRIVDLLLSNRADPNLLHLNPERQLDRKILKMLLEAGLDPNLDINWENFLGMQYFYGAQGRFNPNDIISRFSPWVQYNHFRPRSDEEDIRLIRDLLDSESQIFEHHEYFLPIQTGYYQEILVVALRLDRLE